MKSKVDKKDEEFVDLMEKFRAEAVKNTVNAFNEGYMLGKMHAELVFGEGENEQN